MFIELFFLLSHFFHFGSVNNIFLCFGIEKPRLRSWDFFTEKDLGKITCATVAFFVVVVFSIGQ